MPTLPGGAPEEAEAEPLEPQLIAETSGVVGVAPPSLGGTGEEVTGEDFGAGEPVGA
jgi:hypothetical protein